MTDKEILDRWKPLLEFTSEKVPSVAQENHLTGGKLLNDFETKVKDLKLNTRILRAFIPIIRKSLTKSNNNKLDDCIFDIQKNHIIDKYEIILNDTGFNKKAKVTIDEINTFTIHAFPDITSPAPDFFDEDLQEFLVTRLSL